MQFRYVTLRVKTFCTMHINQNVDGVKKIEKKKQKYMR